MNYQKETINYALNLLATPRNHCKKVSARNSYGAEVWSCDDSATAWCIGGALERASRDLYGDSRAYDVLSTYIDDYVIDKGLACYPGELFSHIGYNDTHSYNDVIALLTTITDQFTEEYTNA